MSTTPRYPVALVGDDEVPARFETFAKVAQAIEPEDAPNYVIIDSDGNTFRVEAQRTGQSLRDRFLSAVGAPDRYRIVATEYKLPDQILEQVKFLLSARPST